ncbi:hypothetical protein [Aliikangiella coralliicola]|uniref:Uncharacterized protein n=1 Tax=Aliikangiella coralliicola TaxID=2592383 RepID=A0A545UBN4_9GAMM|nr:hypothetical protein [Aliikangiella coralliicola]TQV86867.1 hypothetical protein FLL46_13705 [Aliikangiella coralliicola]
MKLLIQSFLGLALILFSASHLFAQSFLSYAANTKDNVLRGMITRHYTKVMDPSSCEFIHSNVLAPRGDQCEPIIAIVPPNYPEIHYFANDSHGKLIKFQASNSNNGLLIKKLSLNSNDIELSRIVSEGRAEIAQQLISFAENFEATNGGNRAIPKAKMVIADNDSSNKPDCEQGEGSELMDSSMDALKNEVSNYLQEQIKEGNYPVYERRENAIRQVNGSFSIGSGGINGTVGGGYTWTTGQYADIDFSDGGTARYVFQGQEPYLDLDNSYTPPRGALNTRYRLSNYFSRAGHWGPLTRVGENIFDEQDACFFEEMETVMRLIATPISDQRGVNAGFAGQCSGGNSYSGDMVTFSYWTQSATWANGTIVITMKKVTVTYPRATYTEMCH